VGADRGVAATQRVHQWDAPAVSAHRSLARAASTPLCTLRRRRRCPRLRCRRRRCRALLRHALPQQRLPSAPRVCVGHEPVGDCVYTQPPAMISAQCELRNGRRRDYHLLVARANCRKRPSHRVTEACHRYAAELSAQRHVPRPCVCHSSREDQRYLRSGMPARDPFAISHANTSERSTADIAAPSPLWPGVGCTPAGGVSCCCSQCAEVVVLLPVRLQLHDCTPAHCCSTSCSHDARCCATSRSRLHESGSTPSQMRLARLWRVTVNG
jgi:hypothetical protein